MGQRVNFLTSSTYALTYRNLAIGFGLWIFLCVGVEGLLWSYGWFVEKRVETLRAKIGVLQKKQEQQLQLMALSKKQEQAGTAIQSLTGVFARPPTWSKALQSLMLARAAQIDLMRYSSGHPDGSTERKVELEGFANNAEAMAEFVDALSKLPLYKNVILTDSTRDPKDNKLKFIISAMVVFDKSNGT